MAGLDATGIQQVLSMVQGQALKIIGGVPILKNLKGSTNELLKLPKHLDIGNVGALLQMVMQNGVGAVLQNPLAAAAGLANTALGNAAASVQSALGDAGGPLAGALGSLQSSVSTASALAGSLSGAAAAAGMPTNLDLMAHAGLASGFGDALPGALSLSAAAAPLTMAPQIASVAAQAGTIAAAAVSGQMSPADAAAAVAGLQAQIDGVVNGATTAINTLQAQAPQLAAVQSAVACLVPGAMPPELASAMQGCFLPGVLAQVQQIASDHFDSVMAQAGSA